MSREARHASNSKKRTPRGSSSFSSKDATKTKKAKPTKPIKPEESIEKPTQVEADKAGKAAAPKTAKPTEATASAAKPTQAETAKTETSKAAKPTEPAASATHSTPSANAASAAPSSYVKPMAPATPSVSAVSATSKAKPAKLEAKSGTAEPRRIIIVLAIVLGVLLAVAGYGILELAETNRQAEQVRAESETHMIEAPAEPSFELAENPIDFAAEQAKAPDTYAWIYVPGTNINLPIMRHPTDDNFYLKHTSEGEESQIGAIYTQSVNSADFSDPVTVVYGHNFPQFDVMFTELHNFEDAAFFDANDEFYIYMPGRALTYKVVAAYEYDNRHIINSFDFSDQAVVQGYFDSVLSPESDVAHVREGVSLSAENVGVSAGVGAPDAGSGGVGASDAQGGDASGDKIVQLSTCTNPSDPAKRYIVTGVLVSDDPTL